MWLVSVGALSQKERSSPLYGFAERTSTVRKAPVRGDRILKISEIRETARRVGRASRGRVLRLFRGACATDPRVRAMGGAEMPDIASPGTLSCAPETAPTDSKSRLGGLSARCTH